MTLGGSVDSLRERQDAEAAVRQILEVCGVNNKLAINPCGTHSASCGAQEVVVKIRREIDNTTVSDCSK